MTTNVGSEVKKYRIKKQLDNKDRSVKENSASSFDISMMPKSMIKQKNSESEWRRFGTHRKGKNLIESLENFS
jgi:hypothetical protein